MDALDRASEGQRLPLLSAASHVRRQTQGRTYPFTACKQRISHRLMDRRGPHRCARQEPVQGTVDGRRSGLKETREVESGCRLRGSVLGIGRHGRLYLGEAHFSRKPNHYPSTPARSPFERLPNSHCSQTSIFSAAIASLCVELAAQLFPSRTSFFRLFFEGCKLAFGPAIQRRGATAAEKKPGEIEDEKSHTVTPQAP